MKEVTVISRDPVLARAAAAAVRQWQYQPTPYKTDPVEVDSTMAVEFKR
jgi:outer membrane biosynthesis protein TonB